MKKIIVITDFSVSGSSGIRYAVNAAHRSGSKLIFLALFNPSLLRKTSACSSSAEVSLAMQLKRLFAAQEIITSTYPLTVEFRLVRQNVLAELRQYIYMDDTDTVVLAMSVQSLELDLLNHNPPVENYVISPVAALPDRAKSNGIKQIIFSPEVLHNIRGSLHVEIRNFADAIGATLSNF